MITFGVFIVWNVFAGTWALMNGGQGPSKREAAAGYTTLYTPRAQALDLIDWKTGAVLVPAGTEPPTRPELWDDRRWARRAARKAARAATAQTAPGSP
ncbi:MAG: hypothetical protein J7480_02660 [Microbacteriaceae bacterium]|nr:hypothetical protein [Microbacteriaceae bacterium]